MRIFPHLRPGFTDAPLASPAGNPPSCHSTPPIPLFRSRRFNPGFSTQFGALHGGLYAPARLTRHIRYTHPLSSSSLFLRHPLARITYLPSAHTYTVTRPYPGSSRLLFPPRSPSFSRERRDHCTPLTLFYSVLSIVSLFLFYSSRPLFSILSSLSSPSLFLSVFLSLSYVSVSIPPSFSFPLSRLSIPESNHPRFKSSSHPSHAVPRGNTCRRS